MSKLECLSVIGTRPQLIKFSVLDKTLYELGIQHEFIDTGQHYSYDVSEKIKQDLGLREPIVNLNVGSGSHSTQTSKMMLAIEEQIEKTSPKSLIVYGDTNSTLSGALVAAKLNIPIFHVEAGLRSFDFSIPEEVNRVIVDHISYRLFAPSQVACENLESEGLAKKTLFTGDLMVDLLFETVKRVKDFHLETNSYLVCTLHRPFNTDEKDRLEKIIYNLGKIDHRILLFAHPRLTQRINSFGVNIPKNIELRSPESYSNMISYVFNCDGVITDSGGLSKEAYLLKKPSVVIKTNTEWAEAVEQGWTKLVYEPENLSKINFDFHPDYHMSPYGDGNASRLMAEEILKFLR
jgi:UDP-N-acetylglucosamine 2-epimerase